MIMSRKQITPNVQLENMSSKEQPEDLRCRFCLAMEVDELIPVFCFASTHKILISHMALACTGFVISCRDKLPQYTCDGCLGNLDIAYACWKRCRQSWGNYKRNPTLDAEAEDFRCRICLKDEVEELISLLCICDSQLIKISDIIQRFSGLTVSEKDKFPQYICDACLGELNTGFDFRKLARKSYATLRSKALETQIEKETRSQTNNGSETSHDNSVLNEFLNFNDPLEQTLPKVNTPVKSSTEKEVETQISPMASGFKPAKSASPNFNIQKKPQVVIRIRKPNGSATKDSQIDPPSPTLNTGKKVGQKVFKLLPQNPLVVNDKHGTPKPSTSTLQSTTIVSKKVTQTDGSARSASDAQPTLKKTSFSNPAEFKKLASQILKKPVQIPSPVTVVPVSRACLVANEYTIINRNARFTWSQITTFLCSKCDNVCSASAIKETCIKCKLLFDNSLSIGLEQEAARKGYVGAYCCRDCKFFSVNLEPMLTHLTSHKKQLSYHGIVLGASKGIATKQSDKLAVPQTRSNDPVFFKRRVEEPPSQSGRPAPKKQRSEQHKPESEQSVLGRKLADKWIRVEPGTNVIPSSRRVIVETEPAVSRNGDRCTTQAMKPALTVEIVDTDGDDSDLEGPEALKELEDLQDEEVLEADMKFSHDPLDIIDTMGVIRLGRPNESYSGALMPTQLDQDELEELSSNEEFIGFEEEQLAAPRLVPLAGRTPDTNLFDTLKDTDEYLMVLLKGLLCCDCLKPFKFLEQLKRHRTRKHPKAQSNMSNPSCKICRTSCTNADGHLVLSSKRIFYYCKFCQCLLLSEEDFHSHRESNHTTEKQLLSSILVPAEYNVMLSKLSPKVVLRKLEITDRTSMPSNRL